MKYHQILAIVFPPMATRRNSINSDRGGFFCSCMRLPCRVINHAPCKPAKPTKILAAEAIKGEPFYFLFDVYAFSLNLYWLCHNAQSLCAQFTIKFLKCHMIDFISYFEFWSIQLLTWKFFCRFADTAVLGYSLTWIFSCCCFKFQMDLPTVLSEYQLSFLEYNQQGDFGGYITMFMFKSICKIQKINPFCEISWHCSRYKLGWLAYCFGHGS